MAWKSVDQFFWVLSFSSKFFSNLHPKVRVGMKVQREKVDFNVQIRLIEGKHLAGTQLDPICDVHCFGKIESSDPKEKTNSPYWDEVSFVM